MSDYLHEDIIFNNILTRLPTKSLLRCTCVCKSWYNLITSPHFITSHLNFTKNNNNNNPDRILLRRYVRSSYERYALYNDHDHNDHDQSFTRQCTFPFPFKSMNSHFTIIGSCNGLLCLSDDRVYYMHTVILWNPSLKRSVLLPKTGLVYNSYGTFVQCLGFGFDSVNNDYKVVRITYVDCGRGNLARVELYKLSTGVWEDLSCYLSLKYVVYSKARQAYVNGATHWVASCVEYCYDLIVLFDMCSEVFREIMLPDNIAMVDSSMRKDLMVYKESLALFISNVSSVESGFCVWVMEEYGVRESWTKLFIFDSRNFGGGIMRPLWIKRNGEVLMVRKDGCLVCYNPNGGEINDMGVKGSRSQDYLRSVHVESYATSLVLLVKGSSFSDMVTCDNLPSLESNDCESVGSCGSECEHNSGSTSAKRFRHAI